MQMITIRDFKKGEPCYVLNMHTGRNREPEIKERLVKTVGRKYVTIDTSYEKKYEAVDANYLYEYTNYGERTLLFRTKQDAEDYVEVYRLAIWLASRRSSDFEQCTLEELRNMKKILEKNQN